MVLYSSYGLLKCQLFIENCDLLGDYVYLPEVEELGALDFVRDTETCIYYLDDL